MSSRLPDIQQRDFEVEAIGVGVEERGCGAIASQCNAERAEVFGVVGEVEGDALVVLEVASD